MRSCFLMNLLYLFTRDFHNLYGSHLPSELQDERPEDRQLGPPSLTARNPTRSCTSPPSHS